MNSKKVKKIRKAMKAAGYDWKTNKAMYQRFKRHIKEEG